jgi:hypothetical protein
MVLEQIVALMVDLVLNPISIPPLLTRLEVMAPSWAIFGAPAHLISSFALERSMVLDWTWEILTSPFVFVVVVVVVTSSTSLLHVED